MPASKKTYVAVAAEVRNVWRAQRMLPAHEHAPAIEAEIRRTAEAVAFALKQDNSAFDKARFLEACGVAA